MGEEKEIGVYVQALPISLSDSSAKKKFGEQLNGASFELSHSSKVALSFAKRIGGHEITAIGYAPVMHEALARGATSIVSVPLFDNSLEQAKSIPKERFSKIIIPESADGPFSGAALCGALSALHGYSFTLLDEEKAARPLTEDCIFLVKDEMPTEAIDIRRISNAVEVPVEVYPISGQSDVSPKINGSRREELNGDDGDMATTVAKRLRRLALRPR